MSQAVATSLFESIGGRAALYQIVEAFYGRVLADPELKGLFSQTDMEEQIRRQARFLTAAMGGPEAYDGRSMSDAHQNMGFTDHHFGLVAGHLEAALNDGGVSESEVHEIVSMVAPLKEEITTA